jgi:hypothetical protein
MDFTRLVFDRLLAAGRPGEAERAAIYAQCREEVLKAYADKPDCAEALQKLEKVIRRQEMQALYEDGLGDKVGRLDSLEKTNRDNAKIVTG